MLLYVNSTINILCMSLTSMFANLLRRDDQEVSQPVWDFVDEMYNPSQKRKAEAMMDRVLDQVNPTKVSDGVSDQAAGILWKEGMKWGGITRITSQDLDGPAANTEPGFNEGANVLTLDSFIEIKLVNDQTPLKAKFWWDTVFTMRRLKDICDTLNNVEKQKFFTIFQFRKFQVNDSWYKPDERGSFNWKNGLSIRLIDLLDSEKRKFSEVS